LNYTIRTGIAALLAISLTGCPGDDSTTRTELRVATFNIAMGLRTAGELQQNLLAGDDENLQKVAAIIQLVRPDILLLNEFDYQPGADSARLFVENYLGVSQFGGEPIEYPWTHSGPFNTGEPSGLDLDMNGANNDPVDSWGFGFFPGQFGMALLSAYPLDIKAMRSFRKFLWQDMPDAQLPVDPGTGEPWYPPATASQLRLSSKDHWDIPVLVDDTTLHLLAFHPSPPVFDGPEDRNGLRNHDEIRLFADYVSPQRSNYIVDDAGARGGLPADAAFVIAGDMNADPDDGDSSGQPILQLLDHSGINADCLPASNGAVEATQIQGRINVQQRGDPRLDTSDFNDDNVGNLRLDYVLPSAGITVVDCGVFWPATGQPGADWAVVSDHRLVWADIRL
jgi:endonuclease/exonuclease/phosphatase family metal-dependent hydrolase